MSTLTKIASSVIRRKKAAAAGNTSSFLVSLPPPQTTGGMPLFDALRARHSERDFSPEPLSLELLSSLLWAADGVNRNATGGRTAPSALDAREVSIYVALPNGTYAFDPDAHALHLVSASDLRSITGYQDFVDSAPLDLIYVANHARPILIPRDLRSIYAAVSAGAMAQNVYLYCAARGLCTVVRGWFDRSALAEALKLDPRAEIVLAQTVGRRRAV
jgi:SagB-type dehydrogenase family enzyme